MEADERKPRRLARTVIYESTWVNLYVDRVEFPGGRIGERHHMLDFERQGIAILVENAAGDILFVRAYRYVLDAVQWELPAGGVERGESVLAAAAREVLEESGVATAGHELLYTYYPTGGISNQVFHVVRCQAISGLGAFDPNEVQAVRWVSRAEVQALIATRSLVDGFSLTALLLYLQRD